MTSKIKKHTNIRQIAGAIVAMHLIMLSLVFVEYMFYRIAPTSFWFKYETIKPVAMTFNKNDELVFSTFFVFKRSVQDFQPIHKLYCNLQNQTDSFHLFSSQMNPIGYVPKTEKLKIGTFTYSEKSPTPPRTCFLKSDLIIKLPFGIEKKQTINGEIFEILG